MPHHRGGREAEAPCGHASAALPKATVIVAASAALNKLLFTSGELDPTY